MIQGVLWKDNAKGFPIYLSEIHLPIFKIAEIAPKDTHTKKVFGRQVQRLF